jgi:signal transduction histidine kinase
LGLKPRGFLKGKLVKEIVALHDGEITVVSREGEGSTFTVYLPLYIAHPAP